MLKIFHVSHRKRNYRQCDILDFLPDLSFHHMLEKSKTEKREIQYLHDLIQRQLNPPVSVDTLTLIRPPDTTLGSTRGAPNMDSAS